MLPELCDSPIGLLFDPSLVLVLHQLSEHLDLRQYHKLLPSNNLLRRYRNLSMPHAEAYLEDPLLIVHPAELFENLAFPLIFRKNEECLPCVFEIHLGDEVFDVVLVGFKAVEIFIEFVDRLRLCCAQSWLLDLL